jgi:hypothetical protein
MMKRLIALAAACLFASLVVVGISSAAASSRFRAILSPAGNPGPSHAQNGPYGTFTATLSGKTLTWKLTFANLSGKSKAAHIHSAADGKALLSLCNPCKSRASGRISLNASQVRKFGARDLLYVDVHVAEKPGAEIRGQLGQG